MTAAQYATRATRAAVMLTALAAVAALFVLGVLACVLFVGGLVAGVLVGIMSEVSRQLKEEESSQ